MVRSFEETQQVSVQHHVLYLTGLCRSCREASVPAGQI
jgi:Fe2+ or Zn2+ uptake regulation protein